VNLFKLYNVRRLLGHLTNQNAMIHGTQNKLSSAADLSGWLPVKRWYQSISIRLHFTVFPCILLTF